MENKPKKKLGRAFLPEGEKKQGVNMQIQKKVLEVIDYKTVRQIGEDAVMKAYKKRKV